MIGVSFLAAAYALVVSILIGRYAFPVGEALGVLDWPDRNGGRKLHTKVTPLVGGTAVVLSIFGGTLMTLGSIGGSDIDVASHLGVLGLCVFAIYAVGLTDDRVALSARVRLAISAAVLLMAMIGDPTVVVNALSFGSVTIDLGRFGLLFTLLCYVGLLNAVNMADGKNGLVITLALIWSAVLFGHAPDYWRPPLVACIVALVVMLYFNMRGRLFLGDGGSYGIGAFVSLLTVGMYNVSATAAAPLTALQIVAMFAVPVFDTVRLMVSRKMRGLSPLEGDRNHLHHHLFNRWGWPKGLVIYGALVGVPNLVAQIMPMAAGGAIVVMFVAYIAVLRVASASAPVAADAPGVGESADQGESLAPALQRASAPAGVDRAA